MPATPNFYEILGLAPSASLEEIKRAYREQVRQTHPDNFAPERARLEQAGLTIPLTALDKEIIQAKERTQALNRAYETLADKDKRVAYDRKLAEEQYNAIQSAYENDLDYGRRTVKRRHHRHSNQPQNESFPKVLAIIFIVMVFLISWQISGFFRPEKPSNSKSASPFTFAELEATRASETEISQSRGQVTPEATLSQSEEERLVAIFLAQESYSYAIERLNVLIRQTPDNASLYYQRGFAYARLDAGENDLAAVQALHNFNRAISLNADYLEAYRERGLLRFALWQHTGNGADLALADLTYYQDNGSSSDAEVKAALEILSDS